MNKFILIIFLVLFAVILIVSSTLGHISQFYNQNIKGAFSGVMASVMGMVLIGIFFWMSKYNKKYIKNKLLMTGILIICIIGLVFEQLLGFYFGASAFGIMIFSTIITFLNDKIITNKKNQNNRSLISGNNLNNQAESILPESTQKYDIEEDQNLISRNKNLKQKFCSVFVTCSFIINLLLLLLFVTVSITYFYYNHNYPVYGQIIQITDQQKNQNYYVHAYCVGQEQINRPTIILQHGGGSNSMAFLELGNSISLKKWKLCAYDRLGYGRSSVIPRYMTVEKKSQLTHKIIDKLLQNQTNKNIIIGGWSAGVQISQIYAKLYPQNVKGMIFLDGYSDYLTLMAIQDGKAQKYKSNTILTLQFARMAEPFGLGLIVGSNQIPSQKSSDYYKAYYRTGYFWQSQYFDVSNPQSNTDWLTLSGENSTLPFPDSLIPLNWPQIKVPLLIMPAKDTITTGQYQDIYKKNIQKYLQKCSNQHKKISIMQGNHGFVLQSPEKVAIQIEKHFSDLF